MEYSGKEDTLKPTDTLVNGESEILNRIASYVKEWSGNWQTVWENIKVRGRMKNTMVEYADRLGRPELMESEWVILANSEFHLIAEKLRKEVGAAEADRVYEIWLDWFKDAIKGSK
jgi:hypothetical protein